MAEKKTQTKSSHESVSKNKSTIEQYPLERRKIAKKITMEMVNWTIVLGIILIIYSFSNSSFLKTILYYVLLLYVLMFFIQLWYQPEYFRRYYYDIEKDFLIIKKGVIMPHETMLPYEKLQDVYMDQDLFDRMFNLWDVHVSTATSMSGRQAHIDGVNHENAEKLREMILAKIRKR